ncbi:bifunctional DedA family/phosphatase PAP2 family protein [Stappia indica]|uniref:bifunctional DedA family/phosphatase PAP2 family protein n=1 Tax=Stappia indica TaxID=538381 RepID=UPI001CD2C5A9|nr:bifunctional DedA family/phosphatase PAP2 family protein [Stappia indica]MCA1299556.1 VTT domain-containing protein [Stappia indica]
MTDLLNQLVSFIGENPLLANAVVFLIAMGEALFIIGLFVPSTVVLVGAGTLVGLGKLDPWPIFLWTTLGAIVGDAVSYWIGHVYKDRIKLVWPFSRYRTLVERGEDYFRRHGGKSVFIGRFVPGVKAIVPGIAGMVGMNATRFTIINVTSAIAWAISHLGPGFIAGTAFSALGEISGRLATMLGVFLVLLFVAVMIARWVILIILPLYAGSRERIVGWFARRPDRVSLWLARMFDPKHPRSAGMLASSLLLLTSVPVFVALAAAISPDNGLQRADTAIRNLFLGLRTPVGDDIMTFLTMLGDGLVTSITALVVVIYLFARRAWRRGTGFLIAIAGTAVFVPLFKLLVHRSRPIDIYTGADAFSFPSGHATLNTVLYGLIAVLVAHDRSPLVKAGVFSVTVVLVGAIAFSRVYLGAHWTSDVIGGLTFGTAMVATFAFVFGSIHNEKIGRWALAGLVALTVTAAGGTHVMRNFDRARAMYQPQVPVITLAADDWVKTGWQELPAQRIELNGERGEPLIVQWAGDPQALARALEPAGYVRAPGWSLTTFTGFLTGQTAPEDLPALPRIQNGHGAELVLIKQDAEEIESERAGRWVLRLWPSAYRIEKEGHEEPVFLGSLIHERILRPLNELSTPRTDQTLPDHGDNPLLALPGVLIREREDGAPVVLGGKLPQ